MAEKDPGCIIQYKGPFKAHQALEIGSFKHCRVGISMSQDDFMRKSGHLQEQEDGTIKFVQDSLNFSFEEGVGNTGSQKEIQMGRTYIYQYLDHPLENVVLVFKQPMPASTIVDIVYCQKQIES